MQHLHNSPPKEFPLSSSLSTCDIYSIKQSIQLKTSPPHHYIPSNNYELNYSHYMCSHFNIKSYSLINNYVLNNKCLISYKPFLFYVVKHLFMNQPEIILYSLYIDTLFINNQLKHSLSKQTVLLFIGLLTKYHSTMKSEYFLKYFNSRNNHLFKQYTQWRQHINEPFFNIIDINKRYKQLNNIEGEDIKKQYLDYNEIVNLIVKSSSHKKKHKLPKLSSTNTSTSKNKQLHIEIPINENSISDEEQQLTSSYERIMNLNFDINNTSYDDYDNNINNEFELFY